MGQIIRCPLTGLACGMPIKIEEKSFFLAEAEEPEGDRKWRREALTTVLEREYKYNIRSALDESDVNAFTCKICEMIQTCAYGIADISGENSNVLLELGVMMALGKPVIILRKTGQERELKLPANIIDKEVIPFQDYTEIMPKLRKMVKNLPPPVSPPSPIQDLEKIQPKFAEELRKMRAEIVKEFKKSVREAKIDMFSFDEEKKDVSPELSEKLKTLEGQLENMRRLGVTMDAEAASLKGKYLHYVGNYEEALASFNLSLELRPDDPDTLMHRAEIYLHLAKHEEALADCNRSIKIKPDNSDALAVRGTAYGYLKKYNKALADFNRSLEIRPDHVITLNNRGITYLVTGKSKKALLDFNRALKLKPNDPSTLYNLGCLYSLQGEAENSLNYLEKAINLDKEYIQIAKMDEDLDKIREDPRFKKLIEED